MEYLNEENYQKMNKKIKVVGVIIMAAGLLLIALGIYYVVSSKGMQVPKMGEENWFDASSAKMQRESTGAFMIIPGIFLTLVGASVRFLIANRRQLMAYQAQQVLPIVTEGAEKLVPTATKVTKEVVTELAPTYTKVAKEVAKEMAPAYGEVAKEISKGIKEGLKDDK